MEIRVLARLSERQTLFPKIDLRLRKEELGVGYQKATTRQGAAHSWSESHWLRACASSSPSHSEGSKAQRESVLGAVGEKSITNVRDQILPRPSGLFSLPLGRFSSSITGCYKAIEGSFVSMAHRFNSKLECLPVEHLMWNEL